MVDRKSYKELLGQVKDQLNLSRELTDEEIMGLIDEVIMGESGNQCRDIEERVKMGEMIFNAIRRLDILQPFIDDPTITEVMVNGTDNIFIERQGSVQEVNAKFESKQKLEDVIQNIVSKINRVVNEKSPICDARLADGSRVSIVLPPVAINGPILTIRKFSKETIQIEHLISWEAISLEAAKFLKKCIKAKLNIFICGGTGSGKTTLLNILSNYIPEDERIITIEDSAELQIASVKNLVSLEVRNANLEGKGEISIRDLIRSSLRMRPDRIIVGEVRGTEAIDMLQAMNTGHDGSLSTGHGNSIKDMLSRLETMILTGGNIPLKAIQKQIASSIDLMIYLSRMRDKSRKVLEISEIVDVVGDEVLVNPIYQFKEEKFEQGGNVCGKLVRTASDFVDKSKFKGAGMKLWEEKDEE